MAFTAAQQQAIRNYLGVAGVYPEFRFRLQGAIEVVGGDAQALASATTWLDRLAEIDDALTGSGATGTATFGDLKKVDEVEFYPVSESGGGSSSTLDLIGQGRVLIQRLARLLGVWPDLPEGDYFGTLMSRSVDIALG
jgi:hypothetical protein